MQFCLCTNVLWMRSLRERRTSSSATIASAHRCSKSGSIARRLHPPSSTIEPAGTRKPGDLPLDLDGRGNLEFNTRAKGWEKDDFAYKIRSIYQVEPPVTLADMKYIYGMKIALQGLVFVPASMAAAVVWDKQKMLKLVSPLRKS